jgi:hypothetical protein
MALRSCVPAIRRRDWSQPATLDTDPYFGIWHAIKGGHGGTGGGAAFGVVHG